MVPIAIGVGIAVVLLAVFVYVWVAMANNLTQLSEQIDHTIGGLAAQLQQRHDLLPDSLQVAREAVQRQRDYLDKLLEVRKGMHPELKPIDLGGMPPELVPMVLAAQATAAGKAVTEDNPELSTDSMVEWQRIHQNTEKDVSAARRLHQSAVAEYNTAVRSIPSCFVAALHRFYPVPKAEITKQLATKPTYFSST